MYDVEAMRRKLKPTSKRLLIDMGVSLDFHGDHQPIVNLMNLYENLGVNFDHMYAFEMETADQNDVYGKLLPGNTCYCTTGSM